MRIAMGVIGETERSDFEFRNANLTNSRGAISNFELRIANLTTKNSTAQELQFRIADCEFDDLTLKRK